MLQMFRQMLNRYRRKRDAKLVQKRIQTYLASGREAWSVGYSDYKEQQIAQTIKNETLLAQIKQGNLPAGFGYRLDERIAEYGWIFAHLQRRESRFLDAGSTFNFRYLLESPIIAQKSAYIYTYYPENPSFPEKRASYVYGDLRTLPFKDNFFEEIVCQSTIEHIDMDNSIYGYDLVPQHGAQEKSYEYLHVIKELIRVLEPNGQLLLTFPYGKFENHGFFQQFDVEMVDKILELFGQAGEASPQFLQYLPEGWKFSTQEACNQSESYNPHTGIGKKDDGAAHSRAVCCIRFIKKA